ncbi:MAG: UDP-N-acetylglucosamine--N-acetylmuramyl-(pentapeptide) pyrophosphoryl-undecaprenol N-acetylglucosamine transferase [Simkaniaceae bacterium]|nr:UDP-N-acetylglucosamine--N-acetylmuramyl-(pentapeptide) pyrophosphoryl-undecaprenol N-acetylglucosamine transferase [Simkaniaceae bacterium]
MQQKPDRGGERSILIAVGGTGGHLFPARDIAEALVGSGRGIDVRFIGVGLSTNPYFAPLRERGFAYRDVSGAAPYRKNPVAVLRALWLLAKGTGQSFRHIRKSRPDLIVGFGSFHSFPALVAAALARVPFVLFESNVIPGRVNRLLSRFAWMTGVRFPCAAEGLRGRVICVRTPPSGGKTDQKMAREYFGLDKDRLTFLVFGGSQGSGSINRHFCSSLRKLKTFCPDFQVIHIVGTPVREENLRRIYEKERIPATIKSFEKNMHYAWSAADLSISRAGAATLAELIEFTTPGILIPYPHASDDHQEKNASFIAEEVKGGIKISESGLDDDRLIEAIEGLIRKNGERLHTMRSSLETFKEKNIKDDFLSLIAELGTHARK